jgi:predicted small lipoprotein YifL
MMRAIKLSVALLLAACLLSGCYMYHPDRDRHTDGRQQQQQSQKGAY